MDPETKQRIALLLALAFVAASLAFASYVIHFNWLDYFVCANKPHCNAKVLVRNQRPDSLKLATSFKIAEIQGTGTATKFVVRDSTPEEQYVVSLARWNQMSFSLKKSVETEWVKFLNENPTVPVMDTVHAFYEQFLNDILVKMDAQLSSAVSVFGDRSTGIEPCGQIFTIANTAFFHSEQCSCPIGQLKAAIGDKLYLCVSPDKHVSFVQTTLSKTMNLPVPTENMYTAPFPRTLTRLRYNPNQAFALTPNLDGLVPI